MGDDTATTVYGRRRRRVLQSLMVGRLATERRIHDGAVSHVTFTHMVARADDMGAGLLSVGRRATTDGGHAFSPRRVLGTGTDGRQRRCVRDGCARQTVPVTHRRVAICVVALLRRRRRRRCSNAAQLVRTRPPAPPLAIAAAQWSKICFQWDKSKKKIQ